MKLVDKTIKELYQYDTLTEFQDHRNLMTEKGYTPSNTTKDGYSNPRLDNYYGEYSKVSFE